MTSTGIPREGLGYVCEHIGALERTLGTSGSTSDKAGSADYKFGNTWERQ